MRYYLGVHKFAPISGLLDDFGWLRPRERRIKNIVTYWNRLIKMDNNRLTKHVINDEYSMQNDNTWCADIKEIFAWLDLVDVFSDKTMCDLNDVIVKISTKSQNQWRNNVQQKPKLRTYMLFKDELRTEEYIKQHLNKRKRSLLAQTRLGILPLHIETGRYNNTPFDNRKCTICNTDVLEDEFHFIMSCPNYINLRTKLFNEAKSICENFNDLSDDVKFTTLFKKCHKPLATYINDAFYVRKCILYNSV